MPKKFGFVRENRPEHKALRYWPKLATVFQVAGACPHELKLLQQKVGLSAPAKQYRRGIKVERRALLVQSQYFSYAARSTLHKVFNIPNKFLASLSSLSALMALIYYLVRLALGTWWQDNNLSGFFFLKVSNNISFQNSKCLRGRKLNEL